MNADRPNLPAGIQLASELEIDQLARAAEEIRLATKSTATRSAYDHDFLRFANWCEPLHFESLPAMPEAVALYALSLYRTGKKVATINRILTSISQAHKQQGLPTPIDARVREVVKGIRRKVGTAQKKALPINVEMLARICDVIPRDMIGKRDKAILLLGFAAALRRAELTALDFADIETVPEGIVLTIRKSKTDQEQKGRRIGVPFAVTKSDLCPVSALNSWLALARIESGPVFRQLGPQSKVLWYPTKARLSARSVALIIKRRCAAAGYDSRLYSGHSLRAGFATACAAVGVPDRDIMRITGHASPETLSGYIRDGSLFRNHPLVSLL